MDPEVPLIKQRKEKITGNEARIKNYREVTYICALSLPALGKRGIEPDLHRERLPNEVLLLLPLILLRYLYTSFQEADA